MRFFFCHTLALVPLDLSNKYFAHVGSISGCFAFFVLSPLMKLVPGLLIFEEIKINCVDMNANFQ